MSVQKLSVLKICAAPLAILALLGAAGAAGANTPVQTFGNADSALSWTETESHLTDFHFSDKLNGRDLKVVSPFTLTLDKGLTLTASDLSLTAPLRVVTVAGDPKASRLSDTETRQEVQGTFTDKDGRVSIAWRLVQPDGAKYLREIITITALKQDEAIPQVRLFNLMAPGAEVSGKVAGSPVIAGPDYMMFENPLANGYAIMESDEAWTWIDNALPLRKGQSLTYSAVIGVSAPGQMRRDFLTYIEAERAHPYRTFLHYNSWYDIGYDTPYTEADALNRINAFGEELSVKRGVKIDSFLFDDGWDDLTGNWGFSTAFPNGFLPLKAAAAKYGAAPGVWLSPWGGYNVAKDKRIESGEKLGYETIDGGFALSGPKYYDNFRKVTLDLVTKDGVNQFKFDGTGNADKVFPGSRFNSDFDAAIHLIGDLRKASPDLFINVTTGTYPSPAWLLYADSIWRGGQDHAFTGVGTARQRWITYRDREEYENIVVGGPLFPLNAVMLHGLIYAQHAPGLNSDPGHDFPAEVHSYFGSGTALQEMYITPSLLTPADWDTLAQAAKWSRANADVLKDTHWIGGDPGRLDVYGWAAWAPRKGIITLRNPSDKAQDYALDVGIALELPADAAQHFTAHTLWGADQPDAAMTAGQPVTLHLAPFEVVTLELTPRP
ncbi:MAG: enterotoxin [Asticcacaulis sp.]|uniref:enterotoxin n=1 Tax=Asticcacaulis sp. TaxID=1872648 RepID=UPI003F7B969E